MEQEKTVLTTVLVRKSTRDWLRYRAYMEDRSMGEIVREIIERAREADQAAAGRDGGNADDALVAERVR